MIKINILKIKTKYFYLLLVCLLVACAKPGFSPLVTEQKTITDVSVIVTYQDDGIYQVQVDNYLPDTISLQWSHSAYVNTAGDTVRLIHIPDTTHFPDETPGTQAASTIGRGVKFKTNFVGESWIDFSRRGVTPRPKLNENTARLYLAFDINGKRTYWTGEVAFVKVSK